MWEGGEEEEKNTLLDTSIALFYLILPEALLLLRCLLNLLSKQNHF